MQDGRLGRIIGQLIGVGADLLRSRHFVVVGDSMLPTLAHRQHVQTRQTRPLPGGGRGPGAERGDIVAFRHPQEPGRVYIKRVVGLPNEHIALEDDRVIIDGAPQPEPYLLPGGGLPGGGLPGGGLPGDGLPEHTEYRPRRQRASQWFTGDQEYFLLGDNRGDSEDSRTFGPVESNLIIERVWFRYWPPRVWPPGGR